VAPNNEYLEIERLTAMLRLTQRSIDRSNGKDSEHFKLQKQRIADKIKRLSNFKTEVIVKIKRKKKPIDKRRKRK
jgi:hypothetical protein